MIVRHSSSVIKVLVLVQGIIQYRKLPLWLECKTKLKKCGAAFIALLFLLGERFSSSLSLVVFTCSFGRVVEPTRTTPTTTTTKSNAIYMYNIRRVERTKKNSAKLPIHLKSTLSQIFATHIWRWVGVSEICRGYVLEREKRDFKQHKKILRQQQYSRLIVVFPPPRIHREFHQVARFVVCAFGL